MHRRAEAIRRDELARAASELNLRDDQRRALDAMTSALVKRLLHDPFLRLKAPDGLRLVPVFDELFAPRS